MAVYNLEIMVWPHVAMGIRRNITFIVRVPIEILDGRIRNDQPVKPPGICPAGF